jgi:hypothetical protein
MLGLSYWNRLIWFALFRRDRGLNDADLTFHTKRLQLLSSIAFSAWLLYAVLVMTGRT